MKPINNIRKRKHIIPSARSWFAAAAGACAVITILLSTLAPARAENQTPPNDDINILRQKLLDDPADTQLQRKVLQMNRRLRDQRRWALNALAIGLELYIDIGPNAARDWLEKAKTSPDILRLIEQFAPVSVDDIIAQSQQDNIEYFCPACSGTAWQDCQACDGSGVRTCYLCAGSGKVADAQGQSETSLCQRCGGLGTIPCMSCRGYGIIKCRKCGGKRFLRRESAAKLDPQTVNTLKKLIARARYLFQNGPDYFSNDILRTAANQILPTDSPIDQTPLRPLSPNGNNHTTPDPPQPKDHPGD